jgi:hypothetical protein
MFRHAGGGGAIHHNIVGAFLTIFDGFVE